MTKSRVAPRLQLYPVNELRPSLINEIFKWASGEHAYD